MTDMSGLFPVAAAALLMVGTKWLGGRVRRNPAAGPSGESRQRAAPRCALWSRIKFTPVLAALWLLFLTCTGLLATRDPLYAASLIITAASSCKLRRVYQQDSSRRTSVQIAG